MDSSSLKSLNQKVEEFNSEQSQTLLIQSIINKENERVQHLLQNMSIWAISDSFSLACEARNQIAIDFLMPKISRSSLRKLVIQAIENQSVKMIDSLLENCEYLRENERLYEFIEIACNSEISSFLSFNMNVIEILTKRYVENSDRAWEKSLLFLAISKNMTIWVEKLLQGFFFSLLLVLFFLLFLYNYFL